jgi:hypothetical protein
MRKNRTKHGSGLLLFPKLDVAFAEDGHAIARAQDLGPQKAAFPLRFSTNHLGKYEDVLISNTSLLSMTCFGLDVVFSLVSHYHPLSFYQHYFGQTQPFDLDHHPQAR